MKKWFAATACAIMTGGLLAADEPSMADIAKQLDMLKRQVQEQQKIIEQLQQRLDASGPVANEEMSAFVKKTVAAAMDERSQAESGSPISLRSGIDGLKLKGDLRVRYEYRTLDGDGDNDKEKYAQDTRQKQRFRHRVRLGGVWTNTTENFEIGLGMEFGSSGGTSANDSWNHSSTWESGDAYLDYAYAKHTWDNGISLTLGQQKNPFEASYALFDGDLRPTGATAQWANDTMFATVGAYNVRSDTAVGSSSDQSTASMYAGQVGVNLRGENIRAKLAVAGYFGDSEMSEYVTDGDGVEGQENYDYRLGDLYGEVSTNIGDIELTAFGEYTVNFGVDSGSDPFAPVTQLGSVPGGGFGSTYDPEDNDTAWVLGIGMRLHKFKAGYSFAHIEGDSVPWMFADSDFGDGLPDGALNAEGHKLSLGYSFTKHCELAATAFLTSPIEDDPGMNGLKVNLYQIDLKYKF